MTNEMRLFAKDAPNESFFSHKWCDWIKSLVQGGNVAMKVNNQLSPCERACSLMVMRVSVAPEVLGSTPAGSEYSRI